MAFANSTRFANDFYKWFIYFCFVFGRILIPMLLQLPQVTLFLCLSILYLFDRFLRSIFFLSVFVFGFRAQLLLWSQLTLLPLLFQPQ